MDHISDLRQDDMSGSCQVINFKQYNRLTGVTFRKFETRYYPNYDALYAVQLIFPLQGAGASRRKYDAIGRLSKCLYSGPDFQKAMKSRI